MGGTVEQQQRKRSVRSRRALDRERVAAVGSAIRYRAFKLMVLGLLCALPLAGSLQLALAGVFWPLAIYIVASIISYLMYRSDKRSAIASRQRIPEKWLHLSEVVGGWPGALVAQQVLRHKTRKLSYQLMFWLIILLHQLFWIYRVLLDGRALGHWLRPYIG